MAYNKLEHEMYPGESVGPSPTSNEIGNKPNYPVQASSSLTSGVSQPPVAEPKNNVLYVEETLRANEFGWRPNNVAQPQAGGSSHLPFVDPESLEAKNVAFTDESIRKGFIRKVYLILMAQLIFTTGVVALFLLHQPTQQFARNNPGILLGACLTTLVIVIAMACCESARRTFPTNFICLGIFTIAESFMLGAIASTYKSEEVLMAVGITAILCLTLSLFAMQTKYDFTACGGFLLLALVCLLIFGIVSLFWRSHLVKTIYASCGALLACLFLIYDTQLMMGGSHKYSISPEEYIFAALNLYMDVVRIFLYVLQLLGSKK